VESAPLFNVISLRFIDQIKVKLNPLLAGGKALGGKFALQRQFMSLSSLSLALVEPCDTFHDKNVVANVNIVNKFLSRSHINFYCNLFSEQLELKRFVW
jgi:hypothetical protein